LFDVCVSGERTDGDLAVFFADVTHAAQMADIDDVAWRSQPQFHQGQ